MRFHVPTTIIFESGALSSLEEVVDSLKASRIVLVTDKGILSAGIADKVLSQVQTSLIIDTIEQNPRSTTINKASAAVRAITPDLVIGLGGGSSLDAAKALAVLATNPGLIEDYEGRQKYVNAPLPVVAIPTTCGTGSEVTWVSVITHTERKFKMSIKGPHMYPEAALVDPDVLTTLPPHLIASTGMDAFTHALEAYTVKPRTVITDVFAKKALQLIFKSLEKAYEDITCKREREDIMLGSTLAGMAFGNSDVGAVHCIAETVGGLYDIPHGVANSIFLPFVMEANLCVVKERYADIARLVGIEEKEDMAARNLIKKVKSLSSSLNIPSFGSLNIRQSEFLEIAKRSVQNNSNSSNPREMRTEDYMEILTKAFHES
ncbi:MAG: iron-containing alcohol dehydrogenase [Theionarchaea archaeon]|nr:iron-containing alcohol dehydrogenase [Theionarchaea archaeon]